MTESFTQEERLTAHLLVLSLKVAEELHPHAFNGELEETLKKLDLPRFSARQAADSALRKRKEYSDKAYAILKAAGPWKIVDGPKGEDVLVHADSYDVGLQDGLDQC